MEMTWKQKMKKFILVIGLILFLPKVQAQDTLFLPLDKLLQQVETNYPALLHYQQKIESWHSKAEGAKSWMPPTFSTGIMRFPYNLSRLKEKNNPMNQAGIGIAIEQMIPNQSKLNAKRDYFTSLSEIEKSKSEWTKNELRREAKILYYSRFSNEKKQTVLTESEEILNLLLSTAEVKFSNNQSKLQTIFKAKARLAELKNMQYMLEGMIEESNIGLNILMVRDVNTPFTIDTAIVPNFYTHALDNSTNISKRSDITAMSKNIESMELEQRIMKIGTRPDFGVRAEHMQMLGMPNQWSIMGMITVPIVPWASKLYSSEVKSIDFQIKAMEFQKQTMQLMANRMLTEKVTMLRFEKGQYENYKNKIIPAFENNLQANLLAYRQNTGDFFVILDAWEMLLMKKMEMYDKLFNILKLEAEYEYEKEIK
jgi:outer membrane protein, heavy metal efflux system